MCLRSWFEPQIFVSGLYRRIEVIIEGVVGGEEDGSSYDKRTGL